MTEVDAVLANYSATLRPVQIEPFVATSVECLGSSGGMSGAQFWRIQAPRGTLALRRWPVEHPSPERLQFIHGVLRHAASRGCMFLPIPVTAQTGQSFVSYAGHLWELAPWMPGTANYEGSPNVEKLRAALTTLATFHKAAEDFPFEPQPSITPIAATLRVAGAPPAPHRHLIRLRNLTPDNLASLAHSITDSTWPDLAPLARQFVAALPIAIPKAIAQLEPLAHKTFPLQPCLRDIWHDHVLFTGNEVTGLVDFGAVDIDTQATDIARLLGSFASVTPLPDREAGGEHGRVGQGESSVDSKRNQFEKWQTGLAAYNTIRPLSHDDIRAVHALHASGTVLAGCNWIRWIYVDRNTFDNPARIIKRFQRILAATRTNSTD